MSWSVRTPTRCSHFGIRIVVGHPTRLVGDAFHDRLHPRINLFIHGQHPPPVDLTPHCIDEEPPRSGVIVHGRRRFIVDTRIEQMAPPSLSIFCLYDCPATLIFLLLLFTNQDIACLASDLADSIPPRLSLKQDGPASRTRGSTLIIYKGGE